MNTSENQKIDKRATDPFDRLIFEGGLRIKSVWIEPELDLIIVLLNNKKLLKRALTDFPTLKNASVDKLMNFENDGVGIHWSLLDEDVSLRGFLKHELLKMDEPLTA